MKKTTDTTEFIRLFSRISLLTQLGLSVVTPPIIAVLAALWLQNRFGLGDWVLLVAILGGLFSSVTGVFSFVRREVRRDTQKQTSEKPNATETGKENDNR